MRQEPSVPTNWLVTRVIKVYLGTDSEVQVVSVQIKKDIYNRPVVKIVPFTKQPRADPGGLGGGLISRRETTKDERDRCQDEIASDVSRMRMYVCSNLCGTV